MTSTSMDLPVVRLAFGGGLSFSDGVRDILWPVENMFRFVESPTPDVLIVGPYGSDIPRGRYVTVGYICENMRPPMDMFDWVFGIDYEEEVRHDRYARIEWHGLNPNALVKNPERVADQQTHRRFCNFVFGNEVPLRERFFSLLSKYKRVDAAGQSMRNMPSFDDERPDLSQWERKRLFLREYKFTIAFENSSYPGYHTEKLTDPMLAGSLPIYWGNPRISDHFESDSFVNCHDVIPGSGNVPYLDRALRRRSGYECTGSLVSRVLNRAGGALRPTLDLLANRDLQKVVDLVVAIDRDDSLYERYRRAPWLHSNSAPSLTRTISRWSEIFRSACK